MSRRRKPQHRRHRARDLAAEAAAREAFVDEVCAAIPSLRERLLHLTTRDVDLGDIYVEAVREPAPGPLRIVLDVGSDG